MNFIEYNFALLQKKTEDEPFHYDPFDDKNHNRNHPAIATHIGLSDDRLGDRRKLVRSKRSRKFDANTGRKHSNYDKRLRRGFEMLDDDDWL
jgi:hypothetical protein